MATSGDSFILAKSQASSKDYTPFSKKSIIYSNDTNNSQYTNMVQFDLSSFANVQNGFLNLSEATLQIPIVITATLPDGQAINATTGANYCLDNFISLKNGAWNIINSISCNYDGKEVIMQNNFTNAWVSYKVLSTWSQDDLKNFGPSCLFYPDSANTWVYNNVDIADSSAADSRLNTGNGICNNIVTYKPNDFPTAVKRNDGDFEFSNIGAYDRMSHINHRPDWAANTTATTGTSQNLSAIRNEYNLKNELKNYTKTLKSANSSTTFFHQFYVLANIP
ncbi:MAG: hypothetical protein ACK5XN_23850 [Bacteroidota bacterium]